MNGKEFRSKLSPYVEGLINEKRAMGFKMNVAEEYLLRLDQYFIEKEIATPFLTQEMMEDWFVMSDGEKGFGLIKKYSAYRILSKYINSLGIPAYYPLSFPHVPKTLPHLLIDDELHAFFEAVDNTVPKLNSKSYRRLANEYRVLFRLLYCCGLRNGEGCGLMTEKFDLEKGIITLQSKGNKTRLVYVADDLVSLCREYYAYLSGELGFYPEYFFPARNPEKPLDQATVCAVFRKFWDMTEYAKTCNNPPTPHDLRFSFITNRINQWALDGYDIDAKMPYLGQYAGHNDIQKTYYYYHISGAAYDVIRSKDKTSSAVIPEVCYE